MTHRYTKDIQSTLKRFKDMSPVPLICEDHQNYARFDVKTPNYKL